MALILLRVLVVGAIAAAADDVPVTWSSSPHYALRCVVPDTHRTTQPTGRTRRNETDKFTWYKDGQKEPVNKRVNSKGELEVGKRNGTGLYRCTVKHNDGVVLGYPINLKFSSLAKQFSEHPANGSAYLGQPYVLSCNITSGPPANISWTKDGHQLRHSRHYILDNELLLPEVEQEDAGLYKCIATNVYLNKSRTSHAGRLEVVGPSTESPYFLPMRHKEEYFVTKGQELYLPCALSGWPTPKITWKKEGKVLESKAQVLAVTVDNDITYTCEHDRYDNLIKTFKLTVIEPVKITLPPKTREAPRARTVRFNCSASGKPEPKITWYKDGKPLVLAGRIKVLKAPYIDRMELVISGITSQDPGVYQCLAANEYSMASSWATLSVVGDSATAPTGVKCTPAGPRLVIVTWAWPYTKQVFAYTVERTPLDKSVSSLPGEPHQNLEEHVNVAESLAPYQFQVRAFINASLEGKNLASDYSETVVCQGQGVPVKLTKKEESVQVSWAEFARENPGVVQWIVQYKITNSTEERNITLNGDVSDYNLDVSPNSSVQVRVLGSRSYSWLHQNLSMVPWTTLGEDSEAGELNGIPQIEEVSVSTREFSIKVLYESGDSSADKSLKYNVCIRRTYYEDEEEDCRLYNEAEVTFQGLEPNTRYVVRAQVKMRGKTTSGKFSAPLILVTKREERVKNIEYKYMNASTLRVSWNGGGSGGGSRTRYLVSYSANISKSLDAWTTLYTYNNYVVLTDVNSKSALYMIVKDSDSSPSMDAPVLTIPADTRPPVQQDPKYVFTSSGLKLLFGSAGPRMLRFTQNITVPMEQWAVLNTTADTVELNGLDFSQTTYVTVYGGWKEGKMLNIPPQPIQQDNTNALYLGIGIGSALVALLIIAVVGFCFWRRRKRARSPIRSRRRNTSPNEATEEEATEMKNIGGRLANGGGSKEAGEPLLNGHVHITENPNSKTPNGKMRKGRNYDATFDLSRYEEADATMETVLDPDTSASTTFHLLDTSRRPDYDLCRSEDSFAKLPDDNMNSELRGSFDRDNSIGHPTLQPNG